MGRRPTVAADPDRSAICPFPHRAARKNPKPEPGWARARGAPQEGLSPGGPKSGRWRLQFLIEEVKGPQQLRVSARLQPCGTQTLFALGGQGHLALR